MAAPSIASLLQQAASPNGAAQVLDTLKEHPGLAHAGDNNGYTLLHAAASYDALGLARALVQTYDVDPNKGDGDGDTPLFYAETVAAARCLIDELGARLDVHNDDGETPISNAETNAADMEGEWDDVVAYLKSTSDGGAVNGQASPAAAAATHPPPPLPPNVQINVGTMREDEAGDVADADPEIRRRIEELAARDDFQGEAGQDELRRLVQDAVGGLAQESGPSASRPRTD